MLQIDFFKAGFNRASKICCLCAISFSRPKKPLQINSLQRLSLSLFRATRYKKKRQAESQLITILLDC